VVISRTVRIVAAGAVAVLAGLIVAGPLHAQGKPVVAGDTTWVAPLAGGEDGKGGDGAAPLMPLDTTW
jgi:hypothetical protein